MRKLFVIENKVNCPRKPEVDFQSLVNKCEECIYIRSYGHKEGNFIVNCSFPYPMLRIKEIIYKYTDRVSYVEDLTKEILEVFGEESIDGISNEKPILTSQDKKDEDENEGETIIIHKT